MQSDLITKVIDPVEILRACSTHHPVDLVPFSQKELGQICTVLSGNPGNQSASSHDILFLYS